MRFCTATAVLLTVIVLLTESRPYSCVEVVGTADTEVLNQILILLVQSEARVISSSENTKIEFLLETDVTIPISVRCFLKNPSHGQVVRARTNSPIFLQQLCP